MHIYVRKMPGTRKDGTPNWGLVKVWYKDTKQIQKRVPKEEYAKFRISPNLTLDEAKICMKSLNAQETLIAREKSRTVIAIRMENEKFIRSAYLPEIDVAEFEANLIKRLEHQQVKAKKIMVHWRACKRTLAQVQLDISLWSEEPEKFYDYWSGEQFSMSYVKKMIPYLNKWGKFYSKKHKTYFEELPFPTGEEARKIHKAYRVKRKRGNDSDPITPAQLEANRVNLKTEQFNWLWLSVWFGLRPSEIEQLGEESSDVTWKIEKDSQGTQILWVYQTKLFTIDEDKRFKPIPCLYPEQIQGLAIIKSGKFAKPLVKTLKKYFTPHTTTYGGRKGFMDLMQKHRSDHVSQWLGHQNMNTTMKHYRDRNKAYYDKAS